MALYREFEAAPVMGDLLVRATPGREWLGRRVDHLPPYELAVVDAFIRQFELRYVLVVPDDPDLLGEVRGLFAGRVMRERAIGDYILLELPRG